MKGPLPITGPSLRSPEAMVSRGRILQKKEASDLLAQPHDRVAPLVQKGRLVAAARVRDALDRNAGRVLPEVVRLLRVRSESNHRIDCSRPHGVIELIAPGQLLRLCEHLRSVLAKARMQRVRKGVDAEIGPRQSELRQEALYPLAGVPDKRPVRDALRRPRIRGDAEDACGPIQAAPVEDGLPRGPEGLRLARPGAAQADRGDCLRWPPVELSTHAQRLPAADRFRPVVVFFLVLRRLVEARRFAVSGSTV